MTERPKALQPIPPHATKVFDGEIFDVWQWQQEQFDGSSKTFEKVSRADTVVVVATTGDRKILLLEDEQPGRASVLTMPAGRVEKQGEDAYVAAKRELKEETGYESEDWELWKARHPQTKIDWVVYLFVARGCRKTSEPHLDPGERITLEEITFDEMLQVIDSPRYRGDELLVELTKAKYDSQSRALLETKLFG